MRHAESWGLSAEGGRAEGGEIVKAEGKGEKAGDSIGLKM